VNGNGVPDVVEYLLAAFARDHFPSNVRNPDGSNGITLHVDYGQLGGGNAIADYQDLNDNVIFPADVRINNFDRRRARIFHYALRVHKGPSAAYAPGQFFHTAATEVLST
jgi:hypothetical protein